MIKEMRSKYFIKNTLIFAIGNFATKFISFFLVPLYTSVLSTSEYGIIDLIYTICLFLTPIITLNISESIMRFSLDKDSDNNLLMSVGIVVFIVSSTIMLIAIPIVNNIASVSFLSLYLYFYLVSLSSTHILLSNLKGKEKLVQYSIGNFLQTLLIALFNILFLLVFKFQIKGYFLAYILANTITSIYAFFAGKVYLNIKNFRFDFKIFKNMSKYSIVLIPTSFMWWIMNSSDRIMVTQMINPAANGVYAISYKLPTLISVIGTTFTQAWLYSAVREKESDDSEEYTNKMFKYLFMFLFIIGIVLVSFIKLFFEFYVSAEYYTAWKYTPFLIVGVIFQTLSTFVSTSYNVYKDNKGFLFSGIAGAILNIVLNIIFIPVLGVYGAALATCLSYITVFIYRIIDTRKYVKIHVFKSNYIFALILLITSSIIIFLDLKYEFIILILGILLMFLNGKNTIIDLLKITIKKERK